MMQFRHDVGHGGFPLRRPGTPQFPGAPPLRGGFPVDYGPRVDDWRQPLPPSPSKSAPYNLLKSEEQEEAPLSKHLWVGNVSQNVSDAMFMERFAQFGEVESVTVYSSRNYGFVNFRNPEDALTAKNRLQGSILSGLAMRIEFAKGRMTKADTARVRGIDYAQDESIEGAASSKVKQSRHLWVGGLQQIEKLKDQVEMEFKRFGPLEEFKLVRDRNCAFVDFVRLEDAVAALEGLHRKRIGNEELRVEYGRTQLAKRKQEDRGGDHGSTPRDYCGPPDDFSGFLEFSQNGGEMLSGAGEVRSKVEKDGGPSEVLWVGFPLPTKVDEEGLLNAFSPFGEIERVKTFPGRTYAFVQFKCKEDAICAKENLDGKLFSDPRVHIRFSKSEIGPVDNPRTDNSNLPSSRWVGDGHNFPLENVGVPLGLRGILSPDNEQFGSPSRIIHNSNTRMSGLRPEYRPSSLMSGLGLTPPQGNTRNAEVAFVIGRKSGRENGRLDDVEYFHGISGARPDSRSYDDTWDLPDEDVMYRDKKRLRAYPGGGVELLDFDPRYEPQQLGATIGTNYPGLGNVGGYGSGRASATVDYNHGLGPRPRGGPPVMDDRHQLPGILRPSILDHDFIPSPRTAALLNGKRDEYALEGGLSEDRWQWHGTIAKGGTPVCRARCLPIGQGVDVTIPDVVNCTARTDLDMLAKHVFQAGEFGVVFFVPEGDLDVPPYQDFMHYLGEKHRAGVAKLVDGTTLFLVPPSEFSTKVLRVPGQNCLFGVVLKFPAPTGSKPPPQLQQARSPVEQSLLATQQQQPMTQHTPQHSTFTQHNNAPTTNDSTLQEPPPTAQQEQPRQSANGNDPAHSITANQLMLASSAGLPGGFTPELLASLTALLPQQNFATPSTISNSVPRQGTGVLCMYASNGGSMVSGISPMVRSPPVSVIPPQQNDMASPAYRTSLQSNLHPQPAQGWPPAQHSQHDQQQIPGMGASYMQASNQGSVLMQSTSQQRHLQASLQRQQCPQAPTYSPPAFPSAGQGSLAGLLPVTSGQHQGIAGSTGQQFMLPPQIPRAPKQTLGAAPTPAPQLPSDQLAQLTALLTQRQQQPAQQQAAAQLLQQHFQQQQLSSGNTVQNPPPTSLQLLSHTLQPEQNSMHQSQPKSSYLQPPPQYSSQQILSHLPLMQHTQPFSQQLQPPPDYVHYSHSQWTSNPPSQLQPPLLPQPLSHSQPQSQSQSQPLLPLPPQPQTQPYMQQQQQQQAPAPSQAGKWESAASQGGTNTVAQGGGQSQSQTEVEPDAQQKRFEATLQLAAALLQQMQQQQGKSQAGAEQR